MSVCRHVSTWSKRPKYVMSTILLVLCCLVCVRIETVSQLLYLTNPESETSPQGMSKFSALPLDPDLRLREYHKSMMRCTGGTPVADSAFDAMRNISRHIFDSEKANITFLDNYKSPCWLDKGTLRCLPFVYLPGMPKSGNTDLYTEIIKHPLIRGAQEKEPEWWNRKAHGYTTQNNQMTLRTYTDMFAAATQKIKDTTLDSGFHPVISIDGGPSTLWEMDRWPLYPGNEKSRAPDVTTIADLIRRFTPRAKFVIILRNPIDRLYSHYFHQCRFKKVACNAFDFHQRALEAVDKYSACLQQRTLRECVHDACLNNFENSTRGRRFIFPLANKMTLRVGLYHVYLSDWLKVFPREQFWIVLFQDYITDPKGVLAGIFTFLDVGNMPELKIDQQIANKRSAKSVDAGPMWESTRKLLHQFYLPHNRKLAALLKDDRFLLS